MKIKILFMVRVTYAFFIIGILCCLIKVKASKAALDFAPKYVDNIGWMSYGIDTGDFNGDGFLDFVTGNFVNDTSYYEVYIFYNDGNANFTKTLVANTDGFQCGFAAGDFDGDGDDDFIVGEQFNDVALFENQDGIFIKRVIDPGGWNVWGLESGDFDGDGDLDFIGVGELEGGTYLFLNDGRANFRKHYIGTQGRANDVAAGDFDGDGDLDFVLGDYTSGFYLYVNDGNFNYSKMFLLDVDGYLQCAAGDFDDDNDIDFVGGNQSLFINVGGGSFNLQYLSSWNEPVSGWATGDFDRDGDIDLVVASADGEGIYVLINQLPNIFYVDIDIQPGEDSNHLNLNEHGVIPVAIFGTADLDVYQIDLASLSLLGLSLKMVGAKGKTLAHFDDINGDGNVDLIAQFEDSDGLIVGGTDYATLSGQLYDGTPIEGTDRIRIVP
jgi:hypothetical protein